MSPQPDQHDAVVERIAEAAVDGGTTVAVAESLTAGRISALLGVGPSTSDWYLGAVVAYDESVKFDLLGVTPGPVVTERCAREMAEGVRRVLGADVALGVTGVGGPGEEEGHPPGTVFLAIARPDATTCRELHIDGDPQRVVSEVTRVAVEELAQCLLGDVVGTGGRFRS